MFKLGLIPMTYYAWDEGRGHMCGYFHDVHFRENFGTIPAGRKFETIHIDFMEGIITEDDPEGQRIIARFKGIVQA